MNTKGSGTWTIEAKIVRKDGTVEKTTETMEVKKNGNVRGRRD